MGEFRRDDLRRQTMHGGVTGINSSLENNGGAPTCDDAFYENEASSYINKGKTMLGRTCSFKERRKQFGYIQRRESFDQFANSQKGNQKVPAGDEQTPGNGTGNAMNQDMQPCTGSDSTQNVDSNLQSFGARIKKAFVLSFGSIKRRLFQA